MGRVVGRLERGIVTENGFGAKGRGRKSKDNAEALRFAEKRKRRRDGNTEVTERRTLRAQRKAGERKAEERDEQDHLSVPRSLHSVPHKPRHSGRDDSS